MAGFYKAFIKKVSEIPVIVYPCMGLETVVNRGKENIGKHLESLYSKQERLLSRGEYHIVILWDEITDDKESNSHDVMTDVWIFDKLDSWGSGPLVDVKIFRNYELETSIGVSAGDGLLMLGREEELRRNSNSLRDYLTGSRATLPKDIEPTEEF